MDPNYTIPAGKFQVIQHEFNQTMVRRIDDLEKNSNKESEEQKDLNLRLSQIETKLGIMSKFVWLVTSSTGSLIVGILIWYFTKK